jgi:cation diffusion facilitator CzcD-associated flavoprotein CzcO
VSAAPATGRRVCVIGAGPCGLTTVKNLLQAGCGDVVCYEESGGLGGNWAYTDDPGRASVHACTHTVSSRRMSSFEDFPMPSGYPDFPSHRQMLAYFTAYARAFGVEPHLRFGSRVERCTPAGDGRWRVRVVADGAARDEVFDALVVCSGHHREPFAPAYPGTFAGTLVHSAAYKRAEELRDRRVLVVGAGNSAAEVAVDVARLAAHTSLSMRRGTYVVPKLVSGRPVDVVHAYWRRRLPRPLLGPALRAWLRFAVGRWEAYGLEAPRDAPLERPPMLSSGVLEALRHGDLVARRGVRRYDGSTVHFADGTRADFDAVVLATGFRTTFPFLPDRLGDWDPAGTPPPDLNLAHPAVPGLFFVGLFQPVGCIWRLADHQARVAALRITGRPGRPRATEPRHRQTIRVDYDAFRNQLLRELAAAR